MFPLALMFPLIFALEPTEILVPVCTPLLFATMPPPMILLFAKTTVPPLRIDPVMVDDPVDFTSVLLPIQPPLIVVEENSCTAYPGEAGTEEVAPGTVPFPLKST